MALLEIGLQEFEREAPKLSSAAKNHLHNVEEIAREISTDIHGLSHELHPSKLDTLGLVAATAGFCREFSRQHGILIHFVHHQMDQLITKEVALCIFRIVQEALRNVVKHSGAKEASVELSGYGDGIDLCVSDAGAGFDPKSSKAMGGIGLISMRERVRLVGGYLSIESEPSRGTCIRAQIPLAKSSEQVGREYTKHASG
jgi:signal transduction histidine kinase